MTEEREFDLVVLGATGFTGHLVAEYLVERYGLGRDLSWALAGRNWDTPWLDWPSRPRSSAPR
jgi:short subunit dehydrogenase-like uncharacterized protein